jgi:xanthine dehydrogenase small subunit
MLSFIVNQQVVRTDQHPGMVLLEFLRDVRCLSGTKEACREGECGACTVLVGRLQANGRVTYKAVASCLLPIGDVDGGHVVSVEGLLGAPLTLVQQLIVDHTASQCGFCTPGVVLSLTGFALTSPTLSYTDAIDALDGNICRCTGYVAIRNAAQQLVNQLATTDHTGAGRLAALVAAGVVPAYFQTIPQQLAALPQPSGKLDPNAVLVAGGTDMFVQRPEALMETPLAFLSQRRDLDYVRVEGQVLRVGGGVTLEDFRRSETVLQHFPALARDMLLHSSTILRNQATLAGNIVNASPIGDATIMLLAADTTLVLEAADGTTREVKLDRFFLAYKQVDLRKGELIREMAIPLLPPGGRYRFEKVSNRVTLDIAAVNTAMRLVQAPDGTIADLRISAGGVGPMPFMIHGLQVFTGRALDAPTVEAIVQVAASAAKPIDDVRGSAVYKRLLLRNLVRALLTSAVAEEVAR